GTRPAACPEAEGGEQVPARRTGLGGGMPAVHCDDRTTIASGLVFQHGPEFGPAGAGNRAGKRAVTDHAGDVQILDRDHIEPAYQGRTGLMQEISPRVSHPGVGAGYFHRLLHAVRGTALAPGESPLIPLEPPFMPFPVLRVSDLLSI